MQPGETLIIQTGSDEYPEFHIAQYLRPHDLPRFHWLDLLGKPVALHDNNIHADTLANRRRFLSKLPGE